MIISGKFIALSKHDEDLVMENEMDMVPEVLWFNIENISSLSCYIHSSDDATYILTFDSGDEYYISSEAASNLIKYMRKERDNEVCTWMDNLTNEEREKVNRYIKNLVKENKLQF